MDTLYIVTGAAGHLGSAVVRALSARGDTVRALVHQPGSGTPLPGVRYSVGDVTLPATLRPLFADTGGRVVIVIHAAGMVSIAQKVTPRLYEVNVNGTTNVLAACRDYGVRRLVYVSSVHAISEVPDGGEGTIWYVNASSVNVRAAPSTEAEVVGRLGSGEATLLVQTVDDDWARIVIQGDGVEGFVAMRYLSAEAP